jgi:hypothetical protein
MADNDDSPNLDSQSLAEVASQPPPDYMSSLIGAPTPASGTAQSQAQSQAGYGYANPLASGMAGNGLMNLGLMAAGAATPLSPQEAQQVHDDQMSLWQDALTRQKQQSSPLRKVGDVLLTLGSGLSGITHGQSAQAATAAMNNARMRSQVRDDRIANDLKLIQQGSLMGFNPKALAQGVNSFKDMGQLATNQQNANTKYFAAKNQGVHLNQLDAYHNKLATTRQQNVNQQGQLINQKIEEMKTIDPARAANWDSLAALHNAVRANEPMLGQALADQREAEARYYNARPGIEQEKAMADVQRTRTNTQSVFWKHHNDIATENRLGLGMVSSLNAQGGLAHGTIGPDGKAQPLQWTPYPDIEPMDANPNTDSQMQQLIDSVQQGIQQPPALRATAGSLGDTSTKQYGINAALAGYQKMPPQVKAFARSQFIQKYGKDPDTMR